MFIPVFAMTFLIARNVLAVVPAALDKIDALTAGVVLAAVFSPVPGVPRRYAHIDRRTNYLDLLDHNWPTIEHAWRRIVADIDLAIETGLANTDRYSNVGGKRRCHHRSQRGCK